MKNMKKHLKEDIKEAKESIAEDKKMMKSIKTSGYKVKKPLKKK